MMPESGTYEIPQIFLSLSDDCYTGEDLCNESDFLEKTKKKLKKKLHLQIAAFILVKDS